MSALFTLGLLVTLSTVVRLIVGIHRETPLYFPDEYLYNQLGRSLASSDGLSILGTPTRFPAVLEPFLQATTWLPGDPELAYRLTQGFHAVLMSLAALPVYALARALKLGTWPSLACAAVALASPDLVYAGFATSDALGYFTGLLAFWLGVRMIARPTNGRQFVFFTAAAVATMARLQYAVLLLAAVAAAVIVERGRLGRAAKTCWVPVSALAVTGAGIAITGIEIAGGYAWYSSLSFSFETISWIGSSAFLLTLACGAVVAPGAITWMSVQIVRPRDRDSRAFGALAATTLVTLIGVSAVVAVSTASDRFFERYLLIGIPLLALAFSAWFRDQRPGKWLAGALGGSLIAALSLVPLSAYSAGQGAFDSPFLLAVSRLERWAGVGLAGLVVALFLTVAVAVGLLGATGWRRAEAVGLALTLLILALLSAGVSAEDLRISREAREVRFGAQSPGWVDEAGVSDVLLVQTPGGDRVAAMGHVLWNRSITAASTLGNPDVPVDGTQEPISTRPDGTLELGGQPVRRPLLVQLRGSRPIFTASTVRGRAPGLALVVPDGAAKLAAFVDGLGADGWLSNRGTFTVYASQRACRRLEVLLTATRRAGRQELIVRDRSGSRTLVVRPSRPVLLAITSQANRPAVVGYRSAETRIISDAGGFRAVSTRVRLRLSSCAAKRGASLVDER